MFGPDEYRYFCTELGKVAGTLSEARDRLMILRGEMQDDGISSISEPVTNLIVATAAIGATLGTMDSAVSALPVPTREGR